MLNVTLKLKPNDIAKIVDPGPLRDKITRGNKKALFRTGALIRTTARRSIKKAPQEKKQGRDERGRFTKKKKTGRRVASKPGGPAYYRVGTIKRLMKFEPDLQAETVAVGPIRFPSKQKEKWIPKILERGGTSLITYQEDSGEWVTRRKKIKPRPTMHLAEEKVRTKYVDFWKDAY